MQFQLFNTSAVYMQQYISQLQRAYEQNAEGCKAV